VPRAEAPVIQSYGTVETGRRLILDEARPVSRMEAERGDEGTHDRLVGQVIRTNALESWFVGTTSRCDRRGERWWSVDQIGLGAVCKPQFWSRGK
jgi:hypothetical protein